ncbi:MAG TPA: hypothetical protein VNT22_09300 [Baekduia sp.]|nr:hypothetical protein [Baekduia sp.]
MPGPIFIDAAPADASRRRSSCTSPRSSARRGSHADLPRDADRLALVARLELGELVGVLVDQLTDLPNDTRALRR